jgi:predicted RNA-binding Zn-ribbon protein involved in translation (DUF1610 family)
VTRHKTCYATLEGQGVKSWRQDAGRVYNKGMNERLHKHLGRMSEAMTMTCNHCGWASALKPGHFELFPCPVCGSEPDRITLGRWVNPGIAITYHEEGSPEGMTEGRDYE